MRWTPGGISRNVEDRRGMGGGVAKVGLGGVVLALLFSVITGKDFFSVLRIFSGEGAPAVEDSADRTREPDQDVKAQFVSFVLDDAQQVWAKLLPAEGVRYEEAKLVLFRDSVKSACGFAEAATGPFYCPEDRRAYIDLSFYDELRQRFGASGDFAEAYVLTHEIGHHVQTLMGLDRQVRRAQQSNPSRANQLSVRMELQADCFAGIWGHSTAQRDILEKGDMEEALNAAAAIGDDRIQRRAQGRVMPESFTHGSAAQRTEWFRRGLESGRVSSCDTFGVR
jgi:predicted metalloprotease